MFYQWMLSCLSSHLKDSIDLCAHGKEHFTADCLFAWQGKKIDGDCHLNLSAAFICAETLQCYQ